MLEKDLSSKAKDALEHIKTSDTCRILTGVALILKKNGHVLLHQRNIPHRVAYGMYAFPGGTVEHSETLKQTAVREAAEELGISIKEDDVKIVHVLRFREKYDPIKGNTQQILILYFAEIGSWIGEPQNLEPDKHSNLGWYDIDNLPKNMFPLNTFAMNDIKQGIYYGEHGW